MSELREAVNMVVELRGNPLWKLTMTSQRKRLKNWMTRPESQACCQGPPGSHLRSGAFSDTEEGSTGMTKA